jgi:hypothetical protein
MTRWEALVRFDDEIREAALKLMPFGPTWVDRLGEAFFALAEDRKYLPNIVNRLMEEAALEAQEADRAAALQWLREIAQLPNGDQISNESIVVLVELRARGFQIVRQSSDLTISLSGRGTSYARSNDDILRLGGILLQPPRQD